MQVNYPAKPCRKEVTCLIEALDLIARAQGANLGDPETAKIAYAGRSRGPGRRSKAPGTPASAEALDHINAFEHAHGRPDAELAAVIEYWTTHDEG